MNEQARYEVRTPMWLWLLNGVLTSVCVLVIGAVVAGSHVGNVLMLLISVLVLSTLGFWFSAPLYRVGGGRNLIRFYPDRVEVPSATKRQPVVFPRDGLRVNIQASHVRYRLGVAMTIATVNTSTIIELERAGVKRRISTLILDRELDAAPLVADFQRWSQGKAALGRDAQLAAPPRTTYDDRLDRELSNLD